MNSKSRMNYLKLVASVLLTGEQHQPLSMFDDTEVCII
ncbi:hypothetical protein SALWKB12_2169 [Snodgrassella communis]|uniref:Uncharacterized protein n=1 Tax=Snodgrassella communis TaxID=2946699 RepID=A0A836MPG1_9NEIS|nr:hypothetical protein SALWKB12_2169 [Snodgrassella communis]KDN14299.1 hypothetical protein SALWKB29_1601 [Snodgrassella communis]